MSQHGCPERLSNRSKGFQEEGSSQPTMELLVETLTGTAFEMTVSPSDTVFAIKSKIFRVEGIPVSQQHLVYNLKELADSMSLRELSIGDGARLRLVLGMRGGPVATRRLPPPAPAAAEPWPDIQRLLDSNRDETEWSGGCKVTVLVFRDGERVNMLRVKENHDGTYSPLDSTNYSGRVSRGSEAGAEAGAGAEGGEGAAARHDNALTMTKMLELRRRMEALALQRAPHHAAESLVEMQKTRSEEALPLRLRDGAHACDCARAHRAPPAADNYARYSYECGFESRYTLLPAVGAERLRARRQSRREGEEAAILEDCADDCATNAPAPRVLQGVVSGGAAPAGGAWRGAHSGSALQLLSSSTSDLDSLTRHSRILPALSRARPREHLHLSDEGLHLRREPPSEARSRADERRDFADERTDFDEGRNDERRDFDEGRNDERRDFTEERGDFAEEYRGGVESRREVGSERRERRIEKIAELDGTLHRFQAPLQHDKDEGLELKEKKIRVRCGLCRKRLSVATVHRCRCGAQFCAPHRYAEVHGCAYDYKAAATAQAAPRPPRKPRLPRI